MIIQECFVCALKWLPKSGDEQGCPVCTEQNRCAKVAGQYTAGMDPHHKEGICGATARRIKEEIEKSQN